MFERMVIRLLESAINFPSRFNKQGNKYSDQRYFIGTASHPYQPIQTDNVFLSDEELATHLHIVGATGSGKTKLMEMLIRMLIMSRRGFSIVDAHGDLTQNLLRYIGSLVESDESQKLINEISNKLILVEPSSPDYSIGFNPIEASNNTRYSLILELMGIFKKIWKDAHWGPRMEELLRNAFLTLSANNLTILETKRLLTDTSFRQNMIANVDFAEVKEYWIYRYGSLSDKMQAVYREPVLNRLAIFTANPHIRCMIGQTKSAFNFREAMDQGKWILINLSKGYLKENSYLLGGMFIAKLQNAAMSRVDIQEHKRKPFYLIADEFENFLGDLTDFEAILSESRKMKLRLCLAHQYIAQIDSGLRDAIFGNAGVQIIFRLSHKDAVLVAPELSAREKNIIEKRLIDLKVGHAYLKVKGERPRLLKTAHVTDAQATAETIELIRNISFAKYARPKMEVETEILRRTEEMSNMKSVSPKANDIQPDLASENEFQEGFDEW
jgi:hypothetical protein